MEHNNKHNHLTAKELFELMENSSVQNAHNQELDDFEKEALEGYVAFSTIESAKQMNADIDKKISQKVEQGSSKNKVIWFSAAASILLIFGISVFYFKNTNTLPISTIAVNTTNTNENKPLNDKSENEIKQIQQPDINEIQNSDGKVVVNSAKKQNVFEVDKRNSNAEVSYDSDLKDDQPKLEGVQPNVASKPVDVKAAEVTTIALADEKQIAAKESELDNYNVSTTSNSNNSNVVVAKNSNHSKKDASVDSDKALKEEKSKMPAVAGAAQSPTFEMAKAKGVVTENNLALRNYVLLEVKKENPLITLSGLYHIKLLVNIDSTIKVLSIDFRGKSKSDYSKQIEKALISYKYWKPEMENGNPVSSKKEFDLEF